MVGGWVGKRLSIWGGVESRARGPEKFLNFNQVGFERVWLLLKERERLTLKVRGRGAGFEDRVLLAGQSAVGHPDRQKGWDGGAEKEQGPISLPRTRLRNASQS